MRVDEHTIELAGSPVFYRSASAGETPPLYLHGVPTSSDDWLPFLERTGGFAPDLIGFGRSGKAGHRDYSIEGYADFLRSLLDHLELGAVQLVAHDWGAVAGLVLAQREPNRVERIVLIDAVPLFEGFHWHRLARIWRRPVIGELAMGAITRGLLAREITKADPLTDAQLGAIWRYFDQGTQRAILRLHRDASEQRLSAAGERLNMLQMPTLVLWGENDPWLPPELGESYASRLPNATFERVAQAGHWPWLERPEVIDRVAEFLR